MLLLRFWCWYWGFSAGFVAAIRKHKDQPTFCSCRLKYQEVYAHLYLCLVHFLTCLPSVSPRMDPEAAQLEKRHVHDVYESTAPYFSDLQSKAWPRVRQFLQDQKPGSLIADIGNADFCFATRGQMRAQLPHPCRSYLVFILTRNVMWCFSVLVSRIFTLSQKFLSSKSSSWKLPPIYIQRKHSGPLCRSSIKFSHHRWNK